MAYLYSLGDIINIFIYNYTVISRYLPYPRNIPENYSSYFEHF